MCKDEIHLFEHSAMFGFAGPTQTSCRPWRIIFSAGLGERQVSTESLRDHPDKTADLGAARLRNAAYKRTAKCKAANARYVRGPRMSGTIAL
jgi:hypothetical protein